MNDLDEIKKKINELQDEIKKLEEKKLEISTPIHNIAVVLHDLLCKWNHTDGCDWHYAMKDGKPTWSSSSQIEYFNMAEKMVYNLQDKGFTIPVIAMFIHELRKAVKESET